MPVNDIDIRPLREEICDGRERARKQDVVAVEIRHDVAGTPCESGVDCRGLSLVRFALPTDPVAIALQDFDAVVIRASVLNMIEQIGIILTDHAVDRRAQEPAVIEARRHDGDGGNLLGQDCRTRLRAEIERAGWMLFKRPHRRPQPQSSQMGARS
jgi:hypothetical protein